MTCDASTLLDPASLKAIQEILGGVGLFLLAAFIVWRNTR